MTTLQNETREAAPARNRRAASAPLRLHVVGAVFRRNFFGYFSNPAGYVFITLFVLVSSWVAFGQPEFFARNLANLDTLNAWMPYLLLFFVPAVTMSIWAEERRQGTDELLLTLPARDVEVVLGKYLAALGIYSVALAFSLSHVVVLLFLGRPDPGVMFATYLGYWLMGAMLIALGMVASLLSSNVTVAFILGAVLCAIPVFARFLGYVGPSWALRLLGGASGSSPVSATAGARRLIDSLSVPAQFRDFGSGVIPLEGVVYFVGLAAAFLYLNMILLGRRHWAGGRGRSIRWAHALARVAALVVALVSLDVLAAQAGVRVDASAERLNTLSDETRALIRKIPDDRPVYIQAYYSPDVPREYVETKADLLNLLKQYDAIGGDRVYLNLVETERYSPEARDAEARFGITPQRVVTTEEAKQGTQEIFLGVAFTSGPEEVVVPFFDRGLPVEYELTRSIRVVSRSSRKKVGILQTDARLLGGFDFSGGSMGQSDEWQIVTELKKQYEVTSVSADAELPKDLDALIVAQPSSLPQPAIDRLTEYVKTGAAVLLLVDPLPLIDPNLAPSLPRRSPGGPFGGQQPEPKGDLTALMDLIGAEWPTDAIVWNPSNPHPQLADLPPEFVFIDAAGSRKAFGDDPASKGLQEVVMLFPGLLRDRSEAGASVPLLRSDDSGGTIRFDEVVQPSFFGVTFNRARDYLPTGEPYVLAARYHGPLAGDDEATDDAAKAKAKDDAAKDETAKGSLNVVVVADLDLISDEFFELRKRPTEAVDFLNFDNVTFILNCVDTLAGDDAFLALRKRRPRHRTLEAVEKQSSDYIAKAQEEARAAEEAASKELDAAQKRLDEKVAKVRENTEMDERTKEINLASLQQVEQRRLEVTKATIEDEKRRRIEQSKAEKEQAIDAIRGRIRAMALLIPPLPALLLGGLVFAVRAGRENRGASPNRLA